MKFIVRAALFMALLALVDGVIFFVLSGNLRAGVYPTNADSIGIPLMESASISVVASGLLLLSAAAAGISRLHPSALTASSWRWVSGVVVGITHLASIAFFALWAWSWAIPHHYPIVAACAIAASTILYVAVVELSRLRPNNSSKPTPLSGAA